MKITINPHETLFDQPLSLITEGYPSGASVLLRLSTKDADNVLWQSEATFLTDETGKINTATQAPHKGSYKDVDPWGLFWSLRPIDKAYCQKPFSFQSSMRMRLEAFYRGKRVAANEFSRVIQTKSIIRRPIDESGVLGVMYVSKEASNQPAVFLIPGSTGLERQESLAALLASYGVTVFLMGYCRYATAPAELYEIPLERFNAAIEWFKQQPEVNPRQLTGIGMSKGAEALLATAAYFPDIGFTQIIAISPSHVSWQGIGKGRPKLVSSWSLYGEPLTFLPMDFSSAWKEVFKRQWIHQLRLDRWLGLSTAVSFLKSYRNAFRDKQRAEEAEIPIEKIKMPLVLITGEDDQLWPSTWMAEQLKKRLEVKEFSYPVHHYHYAGTGHIFSVPGMPTNTQSIQLPQMVLALGGNARQTAMAWQIVWPLIKSWVLQ